MKKVNEGYLLTEEELTDIIDFIDRSLNEQWDAHTDKYICNENLEEGKKRMNTKMYEMCEEMYRLYSLPNEVRPDKRLYADW